MLAVPFWYQTLKLLIEKLLALDRLSKIRCNRSCGNSTVCCCSNNLTQWLLIEVSCGKETRCLSSHTLVSKDIALLVKIYKVCQKLS